MSNVEFDGPPFWYTSLDASETGESTKMTLGSGGCDQFYISKHREDIELKIGLATEYF